MNKKPGVTKALGVLGVFFTLAPVVAGFAASARLGAIAIWYVAAAAAPLALVGGGLLIWASIRAHALRKTVSWSLAACVALWAGAAVAASATGLASGRVQEGGWESLLVTGLYIAYIVATVILGVAGIFVIRAVKPLETTVVPPSDGSAIPAS